MKNSAAPKHLSREARRLWRALVNEYGIDDVGGLAVLLQALEALDRVRLAQARIAADGECMEDRFGQLKQHPLLTIERDSRSAFLQAIKALGLDLEPVRDHPGRPPGDR